MAPSADPGSEALLTRRRLAQIALAGGAAAALPGGLVRSLEAPAAPPTLSYDDGSSRIPRAAGGGDPRRVIVIGAGFAGLTAANALRHAGVEVVVLEARRRLGGRAWTGRVGGHPVDLGCSWIHDPDGNPMARFAEQAGVATTSADIELDLPTIRFHDSVAGRDALLTDVVPAFAHATLFDERLGDYAAQLGPNASVRDAAIRYLDDNHLQGEARRYASFAIRLFSEQEENMYWDRISLAYLADYESPYGGVGQGRFPTGGYRRLVEAMAGNTDVRLGREVTAVRKTRHGVVVSGRRRGAGRRTFRLEGSHVLVTVPLGVLKQRGIDFQPGLPRPKRTAIRRIGFGYFEKVALAFDEPFWQEGGKTHIVRLADPFSFPLTLDLEHLSGFPVLNALYAGRPAQRLQNATEAERTKAALAAIRESLGGGPIPKPVDSHATTWRRDRFSHGAYSTIIAGRPKADFNVLARPSGRILFAGEATNSVRNGYSDGAMTSGIREAKRLLQQSAVTLSAG